MLLLVGDGMAAPGTERQSCVTTWMLELKLFFQCQVFKALNKNLNTLCLLFSQNADRALTDVSVTATLMMQIVTLLP